MPSTVSRSLSLAVLSDDSVHVLTSSYLTLSSFFPRTAGGYHKHISIDIEDFLPLYEIPEDSLQMLSLTNRNTIVIWAPTHNLMLLIKFDGTAASATSSSASAAAASTPAAAAVAPGVPKATASVVALEGSHFGKNLSTAFVQYLSPGFKMPRWHSRATQDPKDAPKQFQCLDALAAQGLLLFLQPQARFFMLINFNTDDTDKEGHANKSSASAQLKANNTIAATKLPPSALGVMTVVDVSMWLGPTATIEKLVALSPSLLIIESSDGRRFVSTGASDGWKWAPVTNATGSLVAHEAGWHYAPADNAPEKDDSAALSAAGVKTLPKRFKPLVGYPLDLQDQAAAETSSISAVVTPTPSAIFVPRVAGAPVVPSPAAQTANVLVAFARNSALQNPPPPSSLYRFGSGALFDEVSVGSASDSALYEVPFPELRNSSAGESAPAEASYHSWLSTLLPASSQLAMPGYLTYACPPPAADHSGVWISKIEQPVLTLIDLYGRAVKHVPIRMHPVDIATSSSHLPANMNHLSRRGRRKVDAADDERLDVGLDEQALQESLGADGAAAAAAAASSAATLSSNSVFSWSRDRVIALRALPQSGDLVSLQANGRVRVWEVDPRRLAGASSNWRRLFGLDGRAGAGKPLRLEIASDKKKDASAPKVGKVDKDNKPHVGGNQWKGGTGGADTAGLGGKGGPYRFDAGHDVHQMSVEEKAKVSAEVAAAARELGRAELAKRLAEIDMAAEDHALYTQYRDKVAKQIVQLRLVLEQAEARHVEREWLRHQRDGDLDDAKIVDAMTGERMVYRRRGLPAAQLGMTQRLPKRLHFVLDVSGSMYRFNSTDARLERLLEAALLIMESLDGFEHKYSYTICGHSGDAASVPFVPYGSAPKSRKERLQVLQRMYAHSQYCSSGDHTLEAVREAIAAVVKEDADDFLVLVLSDANLRRYAIPPAALARELQADPRVQAFILFIASLEDEVSRIMPAMPPGRAFFCTETSQLPTMFRSVLAASDIIAV
jgi:hypothetical protein